MHFYNQKLQLDGPMTLRSNGKVRDGQKMEFHFFRTLLTKQSHPGRTRSFYFNENNSFRLA